MIVGLTGGIGSGKTTVLKMFEALGAEIFIADVEAKKIMNTNVELKQQIINLLGKEAYKKNTLNNSYIASQVFENKDKLYALNQLVHPKVKNALITKAKKNQEQIIIYEAAILFESGSYKLCDYVITVVAPLKNRINRIVKRDGVTKKEVLSRVNNQLNDFEKIKKSQFVVKNTNLKTTNQQVLTIFELLVKFLKKKKSS